MGRRRAAGETSGAAADGAHPMDIDAPCTPAVPPTPPTPSRTSGPPGSQGLGSESQGGLDGWVQCDLCNKWRKLPKGTPLPGDEVISANYCVYLGELLRVSRRSVSCLSANIRPDLGDNFLNLGEFFRTSGSAS